MISAPLRQCCTILRHILEIAKAIKTTQSCVEIGGQLLVHDSYSIHSYEWLMASGYVGEPWVARDTQFAVKVNQYGLILGTAVSGLVLIGVPWLMLAGRALE